MFSCRGRTEAAVSQTGYCRRHVGALVQRAPRVFNARVARDVDAGSCEQGGVRQSVAGMVAGEKNRCVTSGSATPRPAESGAGAIVPVQSTGLQNGFLVGDSHRVEPSLNSVTGPAGTIRLEPKVMQVLVLLAEHAGQVIAKERLIQTVWQDTFVTDDVLTRAISELRRVFGDD